MQITLTKEQVKEAFGELRFMGADNCYRYEDVYKRQALIRMTNSAIPLTIGIKVSPSP